MVPQVKPTDTEDVSWALSTAQTSFGRGDVQEALKWLRRAAEAASEAEQDDRALELAKAASALTDQVGGSRPPPPPASSRPPSVVPPRPSASAPRPSASAPRPPSVAPPRPAAGIHALTGARSSPSTAPKAPAAPEKKTRRKSLPPEDATDRVHMPPAPEEPPVTPRTAPEEKKSRRKSKDDLTRPSNVEELEAMPTQTMQGHELPEFDEAGSTKVGTPALRATVTAERGAIPIMAAARVHLVKGPDGVVRISIAATENSVPVMVVPIEPGTDLSKLLG